MRGCNFLFFKYNKKILDQQFSQLLKKKKQDKFKEKKVEKIQYLALQNEVFILTSNLNQKIKRKTLLNRDQNIFSKYLTKYPK